MLLGKRTAAVNCRLKEKNMTRLARPSGRFSSRGTLATGGDQGWSALRPIDTPAVNLPSFSLLGTVCRRRILLGVSGLISGPEPSRSPFVRFDLDQKTPGAMLI